MGQHMGFWYLSQLYSGTKLGADLGEVSLLT